MDENTYVVTDQQEREIIWSALADYRKRYPESDEIISGMILQVSHTFSWFRDA